LFIIAINSLLGFLGDVLNYPIDWTFLLSLTALAIFGILIGNRLQQRVSPVRLRTAFGWLTLFMGVAILVREFVVSMDFS
jgi:uncharacterized membrane protein YfcA